MISSKIRQLTESAIQSRDVNFRLNQDRLEKLLLSADDGWEPPLNYDDEVEVLVIKNGVILGSPEIVDSKERRAELIERFPDATVMDMESGGEI